MLSILVLSAAGIINLFLGFLKNRQVLLVASIIFLLVASAANLVDWLSPVAFPSVLNKGMMETTLVSTVFTGIMLLTAVLIFPLSQHYLNDKEAQPAEYYAILLLSLVGGIMMVTYENLIMFFVGVEILSISMYVLTGAEKRNLRSNEAALKYLLMGSFATGILLFGVALLYGATGGFTLSILRDAVAAQGASPMLVLGLMFVLVGVLFKVSAAPFHFWTPDVYEGAPTLFTAFMSTIVKTAGFAALYRLLSVSFAGVYESWSLVLFIAATLTIVVGNVVAVWQTSFKRMMAYSSVSHAGYMLMAVAAFKEQSQTAVLLYSLSYSLATVAAFGVLIFVSRQTRNDEYESFNGLAKTHPFLAVVMTISMLSLSGIPLTAGFFGKFYVFGAVFGSGYYWLLIVAVLMSAVGISYYFRVIIAMFMREGQPLNLSVGGFSKIVLALCAGLTILLGLLPDLFLDLLK